MTHSLQLPGSDAPRPPLVTIGDCCVDVYATEGFQAIGGNALNVAVQWSFAGHRSAYFGAVGNDAAGQELRHALDDAGVSVDGVRVVDGETGVTHIELQDDGERVLTYEDFGVSATYAPTSAELHHIADAAWLHAATLADFRSVARAAAAGGVPVSYDFSTRHETDDLEDIAIAFYSWEGPPDTGAAPLARRALEGGARTAVVTCGRFGSLAASGDDVVTAEALDVPVVDTCGAGDSFVAAFVLADLAGRPLAERMHLAAAAAGATCGHLAAWPQDLRRIREAAR
jgi:fructoselysine 6-kinase